MTPFGIELIDPTPCYLIRPWTILVFEIYRTNSFNQHVVVSNNLYELALLI